GNAYYRSPTGRWNSYSSDLNFLTIKDKYSLVAIRRLPWNYKGVMTIDSDIDYTSAPSYMDSLGRFLQTGEEVGGRWGKGVNGKIAAGMLWFWNTGKEIEDSLGTFGEQIPFYFHGADTLSRYWGDSLDSWIQRGWIASMHTVGHTGYSGGPGLDSSHVFKALNYMQNHGLEKIYKAGVWTSHSGNYINTLNYGADPGTPYYHVTKTFAPNNFKFNWDAALQENWYLSYYDIRSISDSLNVAQVVFQPNTFPDGITRFYRFKRNGNWNSAVPEQTYNWFNTAIANSVTNNWHIYIYYTHFGRNNGLTPASIDSIRAVHQLKDSLGLWIPNTKEILNQQAAAAFAQIKVEYINGKRTLNITSLKDWSWGSHIPDPEELYYLTFNCFESESLDVVINGTTRLETQKDSNIIEVQPEWSGYGNVKVPMYWTANKNRKFDKLMVVPGEPEPINHPPALTLQDTSFALCEPESVCFNLLATDPDSAEVLTIEKLSGPGNFNIMPGTSPLNALHCFIPQDLDSTYLFVFRVTDFSGAFDEESSYVHIRLNQSPILNLPGDIDTLLCNVGDSIYVTVTGEDSDTGETLSLEKIFSKGELLPANPISGISPISANFLWKPEYSDTLDNPHPIIFRLTDSCGKEAEDTLLISISFNHTPVLTLPADTDYNLCAVETICFNQISAIDSDVNDSVIIQKLSGPGEFDPGSGLCCFVPLSNDSNYVFIFQAQDRCGAFAQDTLNLTVRLNQAPVLILPAETSYKLCFPGDSVYFEIFPYDPGDSLSLTKLSLEGELKPQEPIIGTDSLYGIFVWHPEESDTLSNPHLMIFQVNDKCGLLKTDTVRIWIEFNHPPVLTSDDSSYALCEDSTVCFNHLVGIDSDPGDSLSLELVSGPKCLFLTTMINPTTIAGFTCFLTSGDSVYTFIFELKDRCGALDSDTVNIEITPPVNLLRGDLNGDKKVSVSDVVFMINYLFKKGPPPTSCYKAGDANCDSQVTVSDVVYLINYLFRGGPSSCPQ
ncbi:MAG: dockerin type I repeat-containing protein, partial [candidate division Zixibacteria bacterium]|nr:dockerin type I repeat-containing protein [candidate division Zixibacteria bacterium]